MVFTLQILPLIEEIGVGGESGEDSGGEREGDFMDNSLLVFIVCC
jgi:hypothetical protein